MMKRNQDCPTILVYTLPIFSFLTRIHGWKLGVGSRFESWESNPWSKSDLVSRLNSWLSVGIGFQIDLSSQMSILVSGLSWLQFECWNPNRELGLGIMSGIEVRTQVDHWDHILVWVFDPVRMSALELRVKVRSRIGCHGRIYDQSWGSHLGWDVGVRSYFKCPVPDCWS